MTTTHIYYGESRTVHAGEKLARVNVHPGAVLIVLAGAVCDGIWLDKGATLVTEEGSLVEVSGNGETIFIPRVPERAKSAQ